MPAMVRVTGREPTARMLATTVVLTSKEQTSTTVSKVLNRGAPGRQ